MMIGGQPMNKISIGEKIKQMRTSANLSQTVVAEYLQVDQSLISKIEKGEREVSTDIIKKLAELLGCKVSTLISDDKCSTCLNIAFRTSSLTSEDLKSIALINRIALNLEFMQDALKVD